MNRQDRADGMTDTRNRRPLVADRRAPGRAERDSARTPAAGAAPRRGGGRRRRQPSGNWFVRLVSGFVGLVVRLVWGLLWRTTAAVAVVLGAATLYFYAHLPDYSDLLDGRARGSVTMVDADGTTFAWRGEQFALVSATQVSPYLRNAIVATEDRRFWWHFGISPRGIAGAIRSNMAAGRGPFSGAGGSTITQQVAKLLCLGRPYDPDVWATEAEYEADCRQGTVWRKIQELPFAFALELRYSKEQILTIYINRAFLGAGARGFEAAAQRYFSRSATQVGPAEAAMLAGLLVAPSFYAPTRNLRRAQERANVVIGLMAEQGYLTPSEVSEARRFPATLSDMAERQPGGWFADWVMQSGPAWLTRATTEDVVVQTTLDQRVQRAAEEALAHVYASRVRDGSVAEAAIVVMSADGAVRAMVGGRRQVTGGFNRATQARRQTGSAFKPFVFALAMEMGYRPLDLVEDAPLTLNIRGSGPWRPRNFTNEFLGMISISEAFARSQNIPAVRISEAMGRAEVRRAANAFGLHSDLAEGPSLALGTSEATLLEMTAAYAGILNGGRAVRPYGFTSLTLAGEREPLMGIGGGMGERVISEESAGYLTWMMAQVLEAPYGTGRRARLSGGRPAAGKTGTTQEARDAWFVGFTADYVVGVWMGNDDNSPLTGVTGGGLPAEIWRETMERIHAGTPIRPLPMRTPAPAGLPAAPPPSAGAPQAQPGGNLGDAILDILGGILRGN
jgi:penicillin-binding protein 1A